MIEDLGYRVIKRIENIVKLHKCLFFHKWNKKYVNVLECQRKDCAATRTLY